MASTRLNYLLERYIDKVSTSEEYDELLLLVEDSRNSEEVKGKMDEVWLGLSPDRKMSLQGADAIFSRIMAHSPRKAGIFSLPIFRIAVAAATVLFIATGAYWFFKKPVPIATVNSSQLALKPENDVAAGGDRATLTLSDGRVIALDSASPGNISLQGNSKVVKLIGGVLTYNNSSDNTKPADIIGYNIITTPKGGQYQVVLPDGSKVWLNSVSSLKFPVLFTGSERSVELNGEAYFDIAENKNAPFFVKVGNAKIQVLGTEFNVMAFNDEAAPKATVINGSVKVVNGNEGGTGTAVLKAGEQAEWDGGSIKLNKNVDIDEVIAWKKGLFQFNNTSIQTIMRQAARWYDIDVEYNGSTKELFNGSLPRSVSAATLFKVFESTGFVDFKIEGKKVIVKL